MKRTLTKLFCMLLSVSMFAGLVPGAALAAENSDIEGHWAQQAMQQFIDKGYLEGYGGNQYGPEKTMTRAQFAALVNRIALYSEKSADITKYTDTDSDRWYYEDMSAALAAGYMQGTGSNTLSPDSEITREQAFTILSRILGLSADKADRDAYSEAFSDSADTSAWAVDAAAAMTAAGYISGNKNGTMLPKKALTRAEGVTVLSNVLEQLMASNNVLAVGSTVYKYAAGAFEGAAEIDGTGIYYAVVSGKPVQGDVYGTAMLSYAEFYSGDVTSTDDYDAVTSATVSKYTMFKNEAVTLKTDENGETTGYIIDGVKNVSVKVDAQQYVIGKILTEMGKAGENKGYTEAASIKLNDDPLAETEQYKTLNADGTYSSTVFNIKATVTDASAVCLTTSNWGEYQINVTDGENKYLRNDRSDEWAINSYIQGVILTGTDSQGNALSVGMEYMQNIWVQPYEIAFNITSDSTKGAAHNPHDNLEQTKKLEGAVITEVTYIMPDCVYIYKFDGGIFVKPQYDKQINTTVSFSDDGNLIITDVPEELENVTVSVSFKEGRTTTYLAQNTEIVNGRVKLDSVPDESLTYTVTITSGNYADITLAAAVGQIDTSVTASQREQLMDLIAKADELLSGSAKDNSVLASHRDEAAELLKDENATSDQAADLIAELSELIAKA